MTSGVEVSIVSQWENRNVTPCTEHLWVMTVWATAQFRTVYFLGVWGRGSGPGQYIAMPRLLSYLVWAPAFHSMAHSSDFVTRLCGGHPIDTGETFLEYRQILLLSYRSIQGRRHQRGAAPRSSKARAAPRQNWSKLNIGIASFAN